MDDILDRMLPILTAAPQKAIKQRAHIKHMAVTMDQVLEALRKTVDPEIGLNIVDLGLLYNVSVSSGSDIDVRITMTSPMCPVTSIILADVELRLQHIPGVGKVNVDLVWEPAWNPEMISEEARLSLNA